MSKTTEKPIEIRIRFSPNANEQEQDALWAELFNVLGIFDEDGEIKPNHGNS